MPVGTGNVVLTEHVDESYEPTAKEVEEYAEWLGMDLDKDKDLFWVARQGLKAPLPKPWKPCQSEDQEIFYFNFDTGESVWDHPCDEYYRKVYQQEKAKRQQNSVLNPEDGKRDKKDKKEKKDKKKDRESPRPGGFSDLDFHKMDLPKPGESLFGKKGQSKLVFDCKPKAKADPPSLGQNLNSSLSSNHADDNEADMKAERARLAREHDRKIEELEREFEDKRRQKVREMEADLTREIERRRMDLERTLSADLEKQGRTKVEREVHDKLRPLAGELEQRARADIERDIQAKTKEWEAERKARAERDIDERLRPWRAEAEQKARTRIEAEIEEGLRSWAAALEERTMETRRSSIEREMDQRAAEMRRMREQDLDQEREKLTKEFNEKKQAIEAEFKVELDRQRAHAEAPRTEAADSASSTQNSDRVEVLEKRVAELQKSNEEQGRELTQLRSESSELVVIRARLNEAERFAENSAKEADMLRKDLAQREKSQETSASNDSSAAAAEEAAKKPLKVVALEAALEDLHTTLAAKDAELTELRAKAATAAAAPVPAPAPPAPTPTISVSAQQEAADAAKARLAEALEETAKLKEQLAANEEQLATYKKKEKDEKAQRRRELAHGTRQPSSPSNSVPASPGDNNEEEVIDLRRRLSAGDIEQAELRSRLRAAETEAQEITDLREKLRQAGIEQSELQSRARIAETEAKAAKDAATEASGKSVPSWQEVTDLREKLRQAGLEQSELQSRVRIAEAEAKAAKDAATEASGKSVPAPALVPAKDYTEELAAAKREVESVRWELAKSQKSLKLAESQASDAAGAAAREATSAATAAAEALSAANERAAANAKRFEATATEAGQLRAELSGLRAELEVLRQAAPVATAEAERLRQQLADKERTTSSEIQRLQQNVADTERESESLKKHLAEKELQAASAEEKLQQVQAQKAHESTELACLQAQAAAMKTGLDGKGSEVTKLESQLEAALSAKRETVAAHETTQGELQVDLTRSTDEVNRLRGLLAAREAEVEQLHATVRSSSAETAALVAASAAHGAGNVAHQEATAQLTTQLASVQAEAAELRSRLDDKGMVVMQLEHQLEATRKANSDAATAAHAIEGQLRADLFTKGTEGDQLRNVITAREAEVAQLHETVARVTSAEAAAAAAASVADGAGAVAREEAAAQLATVSREAIAAEAEGRQLRAELTASASDLQRVRAKLQEVESGRGEIFLKEVQSLRTELKDREDTNAVMKSELAAASAAGLPSEDSQVQSLRDEVSRCRLQLAAAERSAEEERLRVDEAKRTAANERAQEVHLLRSELGAAELELAARARRLADDIGRRPTASSTSPDGVDAAEVVSLRSELRTLRAEARAEVADMQSSEQHEARRCRDVRENVRQEVREELRESQRRIASAEEDADSHKERVRRLSQAVEAEKRDADERLERVRAEARRLEHELDEHTSRARADARRQTEVLEKQDEELRAARRQLAAREAELGDAQALGDSRNRQNEANLQLQLKKVSEREASVEDRQRLLDEKERLLRSAERALQRRLGEIEDDAGRLASEARRVENQRMRQASDTAASRMAWDEQPLLTTPRGLLGLASQGSLGLRNLVSQPGQAGSPLVGLAAAGIPGMEHASFGIPAAGIPGLERAWRPADIETESLSRLAASASFSATGNAASATAGDAEGTAKILSASLSSNAPVAASQGLVGAAPPPQGTIPPQTGNATSSNPQTNSLSPPAPDTEVPAPVNSSSGQERAGSPSVLHSPAAADSQKHELAKDELQDVAAQAVPTDAIFSSATAPPATSIGAGSGLLAVAREQRRRLRKERAALEMDLQRWFQDSSRAYDPTCKAATTARSRELLAEVKVSLDARAQRVAEDLREARAVERMLLNWHGGGTVETAAAPTLEGPLQAVLSTANVDNAAAGPKTDEAIAKVAWEEEALLRHWQAHLQQYPTSMRTAPMSARHTRASSVATPRERSSGVNPMQRPLTARSITSGMQKASRRRPLSARERQAWPVEARSTREPLSAQGVMAGHAAWLRDFHQQLSGAYTPSTYTNIAPSFAPTR